MAYVCETLSTPAFITGTQTCQKWVLLEHPESNSNVSVIPDLSAADRDAILLWMVGIFAVVFVVKRIQRMLGI